MGKLEVPDDKNNNSIDLNDIKLENGKVLENENGYEDLKDSLLVGMSLVNKESNKGKVKELKKLHENLMKKSSDKIGKMAPKMPRHKTRIDKNI